jgi:hypothetical protein
VNDCHSVSTADLFHNRGAFAKCLPGRNCVTVTCTWPSDVPNGAVCPHSNHLCFKYKCVVREHQVLTGSVNKH